MAGLGLTITMIDLFLRTSRVHDILLPDKHVPLIIMLIGFVALLTSGRLFEFLLHPLGRWISAFTVLALLSTGVSVWPGGAYQYLMEVWIPGLPALVMICAFVRTYVHLRKTIVCTACGYGMIPYFVMLLGIEIGVERVALAQYTLGDSNEMALAILFWAPFAVWTILDKRTRIWIKLFLAGAMLLAVPVFFRTGSRSGLLTLGFVGLYLLYRQSTAVRLRVALAAAIAIPIGWAATPEAVLDRYRTILSLTEASDPIADPVKKDDREVNEAAVSSAVASTDARLALLKRSIAVTLANPILGVGPGMFMVAENEMAVSDGRRRGYWKASHNMYTQISADMGIPALLLFLYILSHIWRLLTMAEKPDPVRLGFAPELRRMAFGLKLSFLTLMTGGLTLSVAYSSYMLYLCAVSMVIHRLMAYSPRRRSAEAEPVAADEPARSPAVRQPAPALTRTPLASGG